MGCSVSYGRYRANEIAKHAELLRHWLHDDLRCDGENRLGVEFKYDQRFRQTGNLYIETAEKARPRRGEYAPSGIYRDDNTWLWVQGDHQSVAVFLKRELVRLAEGPWSRVRTETSQGWLLPMEWVPLFALCVVHAPPTRPNGAQALDLVGLFTDA